MWAFGEVSSRGDKVLFIWGVVAVAVLVPMGEWGASAMPFEGASFGGCGFVQGLSHLRLRAVRVCIGS